MGFEATKHAIAVIAERGIRAEWIERALESPAVCHADPSDPELEHRLVIIAELVKKFRRERPKGKAHGAQRPRHNT